MTRKSNLMVLMVIFLLSISITNCSDDTKEDSLVGIWVLTNVKSVQMGIPITVDPDVYGLSWIITIKDDNTFTMSITRDGETTTGDGEWATSGNQLVFTGMEETSEYDYSLKGDKLELSGEVIIEGTPIQATLVFTRQ